MRSTLENCSCAKLWIGRERNEYTLKERDAAQGGADGFPPQHPMAQRDFTVWGPCCNGVQRLRDGCERCGRLVTALVPISPPEESSGVSANSSHLGDVRRFATARRATPVRAS